MQLRVNNPFVFKTVGTGFKQSLSAIFTGITVAGVFSTVIFNSSLATEKANSAFESTIKFFQTSPIYSGIEKVGERLKNWGITAFSAKDDFKEWLYSYFNPSGFKSGAVQLYEKLISWATIVYEWFKDKFIEFIKNIPEMVKHWKNLRLSLFKWGTFLGGGGGAALWSMFGSFADFGKLADLMGNEQFMKAAEMFGELVDKNPDTFSDMGEENMKEIFERMAEEPEDAQEIIKELQEKQEEMSKEAGEEQKDPQLKKEQVMEAFKQAKGSPQSKDQVFGLLAGDMLQNLSNSKSYFGDTSPKFIAQKAINEYMKKVDEESKKDTKSGKAYKEFKESMTDEERKKLMEELSDLASEAFLKSTSPSTFDSLKDKFEELMELRYTQPMEEEGDKDSGVQIKGMVIGPSK